MPVRTVSQKFIRPWGGKIFKGLWGRPTRTADFGSSLWQIPFSNNTCLLEDKIQNWGTYLFRISYGSYALDQRSGNGLFSGWFKVFVICKRNSNAEFWSTRCEDCFSTEQNHQKILTSRKRSVWRKWKLKKRTVSFAEDRLLTWSTNTSGSLGPTILSRIVPTYLQLFLEMTIFRNSIRNAAKFYYRWHKSHLITSWKSCTNSEYESLRNSRPYWNCTMWLSQNEDNGKRKYRAEFANEEFWGQKWKFWNKRRGQES